jgi:hypothetical protein
MPLSPVLCEVCAAPALLQCQSCHSAYYCSKTCKKVDAARHMNATCRYWQAMASKDTAERAPMPWMSDTKAPESAVACMVHTVPSLTPTPPTRRWYVDRAADGSTVLHDAVRRMALHQIRVMLEEGFFPDVRDRAGRTPLFYCVTAKGGAPDALRAKIAKMLCGFAADSIRPMLTVALTAPELADRHGFPLTAATMRRMAIYDGLSMLQEQVPDRLSTPVTAKLGHKWIDVRWRALTVWWLWQAPRSTVVRPFAPYVDEADGSPETLARLYDDVASRHQSFIRCAGKTMDKV